MAGNKDFGKFEAPVPIRFGNSALMVKKCTRNLEFSSMIKSFLPVMPDLLKRMQGAEALLIKVNLTSDEPPANGRTTNPFVLQSLIRALIGVGIPPSRMIVADSSVIGTNTIQSAITAGILEVCEKYNIT